MGNIAKTNLLPVGRINDPHYNKKASQTVPSPSQGKAAVMQKNAQLKRMAKDNSSSISQTTADGKKVFSSGPNESVLSLGKAYTDSLQASRAKKKSSSNAVKKLQYSFKKVSSQIVRSKTSRAAKSAVSVAKREVLRLKRLKGSGEYEAEEIDAALTHAKSMERIARKKAAHLEQEEMIQVTDDGTGTMSLKDALEAERNKELDTEGEMQGEDPGSADELSYEEVMGDATYQSDPYLEETYEFSEDSEYLTEAMSDFTNEISAQMEEFAAKMSEEMAALMSEISMEMQELMETFDLMEELSAPVGKMNAADFKMLKIKHRGDEMKEIAKADKEYLKAIFKHQSEAGKSAISTVPASQSFTPRADSSAKGVALSGAAASGSAGFISMPHTSMPQAPLPAAPSVSVSEGMNIDISL